MWRVRAGELICLHNLGEGLPVVGRPQRYRSNMHTYCGNLDTQMFEHNFKPLFWLLGVSIVSFWGATLRLLSVESSTSPPVSERSVKSPSPLELTS